MRETKFPRDSSRFPAIRRERLTTLQVNLGYKCNLSCVHCHVNAGPLRTEMMSSSLVDEVIRVLSDVSPQTLDLTGGAPELHTDFRRLVMAGRERGIEVIDRCNLTVLFEPGQETLANFLAEQEVTVIASLPCYLDENVQLQRGTGVHGKSIRAIRLLNSLGYGGCDQLKLHLAFNPIGPVLPPGQAELEADYKKELGDRYGIRFNRLFTITNMPINRFGAVLLGKGQFEDYMALLRKSYRPENLDGIMCRNSISVDWRGNLYDCDFNQMLGMTMGMADAPARLKDLESGSQLADAEIATADHCFGCTAGQGSSCTGALTGRVKVGSPSGVRRR